MRKKVLTLFVFNKEGKHLILANQHFISKTPDAYSEGGKRLTIGITSHNDNSMDPQPKLKHNTLSSWFSFKMAVIFMFTLALEPGDARLGHHNNDTNGHNTSSSIFCHNDVVRRDIVHNKALPPSVNTSGLTGILWCSRRPKLVFHWNPIERKVYQDDVLKCRFSLGNCYLSCRERCS